MAGDAQNCLKLSHNFHCGLQLWHPAIIYCSLTSTGTIDLHERARKRVFFLYRAVYPDPVARNAAKMLHSWILFFIFITKRSIVDPDPHWVRIQWLCRYGSGSGLRTNSGYGYGSIESIRAHIPVCVEQNTYVQYTNCISALKIKNKNEKTCYRVYCTVFFRRKNKILLFNFF
jgi:hypothetical protein